jgi:hypothetical protein
MITFSNYFCEAAGHKTKVKASEYYHRRGEGYVKKDTEVNHMKTRKNFRYQSSLPAK